MGLKLKSSGGTGSVQLNCPDNHNLDTSFTLPTTNVTGGEFVLADGSGNVNIDSGTLYVDAVNNRVGVGTASPTRLLTVQSTGNANFCIKSSNTGVSQCMFGDTDSDVAGNIAYSHLSNSMAFEVNGSTKATIDSSGRLLVGTASAGGVELIQVQGVSSSSTAPGGIALRRSSLGNTDDIGFINFSNASGNVHAQIKAFCDGTPGANTYPGALVFSTTSTTPGASPTEAMRINNTGSVMIQTTQLSSTSDGCYFNSSDNSNFHQVLCHSSSNSGLANLYINRQASDGTLIEFRQADATEGSISVSGTTVTYGGGHLARWSQLPNDEDPSTLLKGTVMSNLDEMCEWGEEDNEQLNKTKVSDVEGDKNVAGVFVSTSFSDDGPLDFFVAMTGDMIIRIAEGVTVERGDLLMSAGDGTAKPQDDDIIRSKTIAKVTSTNVSYTYDDGSYCVPCVLMAC